MNYVIKEANLVTGGSVVTGAVPSREEGMKIIEKARATREKGSPIVHALVSYGENQS